MTDNKSSWDVLLCPYYFSEVEAAIARGKGARRYGPPIQIGKCAVSYEGPATEAVTFSYLPETYPKYELQCAVSYGASNAFGVRETIPLWFLRNIGLIHQVVPDSFSDQESLAVAADQLISILGSEGLNLEVQGPEKFGRWVKAFDSYLEQERRRRP